MKHTPGPWNWVLYHDAGGVRAWRLVSPHKGRLIVMDFVRLGMQSAQPRFSDRNRKLEAGLMHPASEFEDLNDNPDARLIAAASDQLEACQKALTVLMGWGHTPEIAEAIESAGQLGALDGLTNILMNAISKAEPPQP